MRWIYTIFMLFLVAGCSIKQNSYYLLEGDRSIVEVHKTSRVIGIKKIELPRYFEQSNLATKVGKNRVIFTNKAHWISDMDEHLTKVLISYLKRYFNTTNIYLYPWDVDKKIDTIIKIKIENFIYDGKSVILEASWEIKSGKKSVAKFFKTSIRSQSDSDSIVSSMDKAFGELEKQIARSLI